MLGLSVFSGSVIKSKHIFVDTFDRDASDSLGNGWIALSGQWGIQNGRATILATGNVRDTAVINFASDLSVEMTYVSSDARLAFRVTDVNNMFFFGGVSSAEHYQLYRVSQGASTSLGSSGKPKQFGDVLKVEAKGDLIRCFVNGELVIEVTESFNRMAKQCGMTAYRTSGVTFDNFRAEEW